MDRTERIKLPKEFVIKILQVESRNPLEHNPTFNLACSFGNSKVVIPTEVEGPAFSPVQGMKH
jgi:hypothetical protein